MQSGPQRQWASPAANGRPSVDGERPRGLACSPALIGGANRGGGGASVRSQRAGRRPAAGARIPARHAKIRSKGWWWRLVCAQGKVYELEVAAFRLGRGKCGVDGHGTTTAGKTGQHRPDSAWFAKQGSGKRGGGDVQGSWWSPERIGSQRGRAAGPDCTWGRSWHGRNAARVAVHCGGPGGLPPWARSSGLWACWGLTACAWSTTESVRLRTLEEGGGDT
jgi:hypothetical protein